MSKSSTCTVNIDDLLDTAIGDIKNILSEENYFNDTNIGYYTVNFVTIVEKIVYNIIDYRLKNIPVVNSTGITYLKDCLSNIQSYSEKKMMGIDKRGCKIYNIIDFTRMMGMTDMYNVIMYALTS